MLANSLSMLRILLAPAVAWGLYRDGQGIGPLTLILMLGAGITDFLDGWAARRAGTDSQWGRILDPVADKLFVGAICLSLVLWREFPTWLLALQVGRDAAILLTGVVLLRTRRIVVAASVLGKVATWSMAITILAHVLDASAMWRAISYAITTALIVASSAGYAGTAIRLVRQSPGPSSASRDDA